MAGWKIMKMMGGSCDGGSGGGDGGVIKTLCSFFALVVMRPARPGTIFFGKNLGVGRPQKGNTQNEVNFGDKGEGIVYRKKNNKVCFPADRE